MAILARGLAVSIVGGRALLLHPVAVPDGDRVLRFVLHRCTSEQPLRWPRKETTVDVEVCVSYDGGETWERVTGGRTEGGIFVRRDGTELDENSFEGQMREGAGRLVRVDVVVTNGPLVTEAQLRSR